MIEEARFFLRTALYTGLIGVIYWLVSHDRIGTILLAALFLAALFFVVVVAVTVPGASGDSGERASGDSGERAHGDSGAQGRGGPLGTVARLLGFDDAGRAEAMNLPDEVFPTRSGWPITVAIAALLMALGLLYGAWLWIPGAGLGIATGIGWLTQLEDG
jgi:hypothetical protein